ncbi:hypothetical protein SAMN05444483_102424 [Salegentibacter echinorum]|uniref:Lipoprotein n=1 Tax=Salegentibacter echinorum TaxID=1073325 RepID=A0A1M5ELU9_SALEC|nr:hypothetical protein [Salegentibacter echinorum]SHF80061.1 hypothetical protein SAMN05444483_102424 [Salegentibacter echinorum]
MKKIFVLIALITLAACGNKNVSKDRFFAENIKDMNAEELAKTYPEANIYEDSGMFEEGSVERAFSVLYPDTPNELHVTWKDSDRTKIHDIRFSKDGKWKTKKGIKIGTTYEALNKLNKKEISFYGFGWDYGGAVMWNEGELEDSGIRVFLAPGDQVANKYYGDRIVKATSDEIKALNLKVTSIMLVE